MKKIYKGIFVLAMVLFLSSCSSGFKNINEDGSFVLTKTGLEKDFTDKKNTKITWYTDTRCPDCTRASSNSEKYIKKSIKDGKVEVKYYPLALLEKKSKYSLDGAVAILGVAEYEPEKIQEFLSLMEDDKGQDIKERNVAFIKENYQKAKISEDAQNKIKANKMKFENLVKHTTTLAKEKYKDDFFVPFILVNDSEEPLEGESEDTEKDIVGPIQKAIKDLEKCGVSLECGH